MFIWIELNWIEGSMIKILTDYSRFKIDEDGTGNVFASSSLTEEGVESVITTSNGFVRGHLAIRLDTMFQAVKFPAGITDLDTGLSEMNRDALSLKRQNMSV